MPYIKQQFRDTLDTHINNLVYAMKDTNYTSGDVNYVITSVLKGLTKDNLCYETINKLVGVLECAKLEYYRRVATPYEQQKISENGDVY